MTSARTESALSAFPLRLLSKYLLRGHKLYHTIHIYTSACREAYRKAHCDYSLLYINIVKKQKNSNIIRKSKKIFLSLEKEVNTFTVRLLLPLPPQPKGMGLSGLNKMNN